MKRIQNGENSTQIKHIQSTGSDNKTIHPIVLKLYLK
jgi:hypothetical protein